MPINILKNTDCIFNSAWQVIRTLLKVIQQFMNNAEKAKCHFPQNLAKLEKIVQSKC